MKFKSYLLSSKSITYARISASFFPYIYYTFMNIDPLHDGWFTSPATAIANGAIPYKDVVTSYGWVSPVILSVIVKIGGFHLIYFRLLGLFLLLLICVLFFLILRSYVGIGKAGLALSMWLLINLGGISRDSNSLPAWGFWPNQLIVAISLLAIYLLVTRKDFRLRSILVLGFLAGVSPWIRGQGLLTLLSVLVAVSQSISVQEFRRAAKHWVLFLLVSIATFLAPFIFLIRYSALRDFLWQTVEMPRTGEWVGMPNPITWIFQNIGLSFGFLFVVSVCAFFVSRFKVPQKVFFVWLSLFLLVLWNLRLDSESHSTNFIFRKMQSFAHLYVNYNYFSFPILVILGIFLLLVTYKGFQYLRFNLNTPRSDFNIYILSVPAVTLIYYNFGHLWGVSPLIIVTLFHYYSNSTLNSKLVSQILTCLVSYSVIVSALAIPQIYSNMIGKTYAYNAPGLEFMRGQNRLQVRDVTTSINIIRRIPKSDKAFFLCENALYSVSKNRYISDNIFYGTSMTKFDLRSLAYKVPRRDTRFLIYCPGSNTIEVGQLPGKWEMADFSSKSDFRDVQIFKRGYK